jgi:hypothetical protein
MTATGRRLMLLHMRSMVILKFADVENGGCAKYEVNATK